MTASLIAGAEESYRRGDYLGAAKMLEPAAAEDTPIPDVLRLLGLCRLRLGALDKALDLLARAHAAAPEDPWAKLHYGIGLQAAGRPAEAARLFRQCTTALPEDPAPHLNLSTAMLSLGDVAAAVRHARRARLRAPAMPPPITRWARLILRRNVGRMRANAFARPPRSPPASPTR